MKFVLISFVLAASFIVVKCEHMVLGETLGRQVIHHTVAQYPPINNLRRLKYVVYTNLEMRPIVGIDAHDNMESNATVNILAGGIGFPFVTIKLKSERSRGLNYDVRIYG